MARRATNHYVNNKQLLAVMIEYREGVEQSKANGTDKPPIPRYVGECLMKIAEGLSHKPNFINYTYRDEMISDGIENCINYIDNFDPEKSSNPFAYFTQIIYYAFLRRIQKEKKQLYIKHKSMENNYLMDMLADAEAQGAPVKTTTALANDYINNFVEDFESKIEKRKVVRKQGLDNFFDEDDQ